MRKRVGDFIRRFGVKMILKEVVVFLETTDDENLDILRDDVDTALKEFEERERNSSGGKRVRKYKRRWIKDYVKKIKKRI